MQYIIFFALDTIFLLFGLASYLNSDFIGQLLSVNSSSILIASGTALWIGVGRLINHCIRIVIFNEFSIRPNTPKLPSLLINGVQFFVWILTGLFFLEFYYDYNLNGLWAASSVTIAVLGFSLRGMLVDLFSGLAMAIERPFDIGDWIEIENGFIGQVVEMNWRVTKIIAKNNLSRSIPNGVLATAHFSNYGQKSHFMEIIEIEFDYKIDAKKADRILLSAANAIPEIQQSIKKADTRIKDFTHRGVKWQLRFWISHFDRRDAILYGIKKNILNNLNYSNIIVPREKIDLVYTSGIENSFLSDIELLLERIPLFSELTTEELHSLSSSTKKIEVAANTQIITLGDYGDSLFILAEGLLSIHIPNRKKSSDETIEVAKICAGEFFGEMSLLTGEPRSATVIADLNSIMYEINQENLKPLFTNRPSLLNSFVEYLKNRSIMNERFIHNHKQEEVVIEKEKLLSKISKIFFSSKKF